MIKKQKILLFLLIIGLTSFLFVFEIYGWRWPDNSWKAITSCDNRITNCDSRLGRWWNPNYWYINSNSGQIWCVNHPFPPSPPAPPPPPPPVPPTASSLSIIKGDYCSIPSHTFSWTYSDGDGHAQSRFRLQIDNNSNFSSPSVSRDYTGRSNPSPTTNNQNILVSTSPDSPGSDRLAYNTTYYWRVSVWDSTGASSGWVSGSSFTTPKHRYPTIDFSWAPNEPSANENIQFTDQSTVYGGSSKSSWLWTFPDGTPANSDVQIPIVRFISAGVKNITLKVTDSDGYSCSKSSNNNVIIGEGLPGWEEITPF